MKQHLAGIIPVANLQTDYEIETPEILMPVNAGFTAIQKSVFECSLAGCNTIWIVANQDLAPIVKKVVGEWVYDPVYYNQEQKRFYREHRREIPIYYIPIDDKDMNRRDSYGWSILHGVNTAWWVGNRLSRWLVPDKYFISFPMAAHDVYSIRQYRKEISSEQNFFLTYENKTVKDNLPLSFTMKGQDYLNCRRNITAISTRKTRITPEGRQNLPLSERWSARFFDLSTVLDKMDTDNGIKQEADWFFDLTSWQGYKNFLGSGHEIAKPYKDLTGPHRHVKLIEH